MLKLTILLLLSISAIFWWRQTQGWDFWHTSPTPTLQAKAPKNVSPSLKEIKEEIWEFTLGDKVVKAVMYQVGDYKQEVYFNMHDNENTCVDATKQIIQEFGGRFIELQHGGAREISFRLNGVLYKVDPNRIYTYKGVEATLRNYGSYSAEAHEAVYQFGQALIAKILADAQMVVAMHNNFNTKTFSVYSFATGGVFDVDASDTFITNSMGSGDFFYVTTEQFFNFFKEKNINAVLQDNSNVTDDGSLAVYCGQQNIPYINCEAEHGHLTQQVEMLRAMQPLWATKNQK